ncbi:MAG: alanine--tRNA ligase [Candidatus Acidiferrales bacterium]
MSELKWPGNKIRETFLKFFEERGHKRLTSSSLVPRNDPTLLFTNAGMNQFKDVFLGLEQRDYKRATTCQKCVRAGGKHNDLENVGFTNRHHTFFEMLGNFSFGESAPTSPADTTYGYFKKEAIAYAWELVTSSQWFEIPKDKLYVTIFDDPDKAAASWELGFDVKRDDEAEKYWLEAGIAKERIFPGDRKDNFWQMGDTGPCGPCSEIHYDMGPAASEQGHLDCKFPCPTDCGRYVEIWNLVFMQYDRQPGGTKMLSKSCVDTGMGLERVTAVLQNKISNFDTDLFTPLMEEAAKLTHAELADEMSAALEIVLLRNAALMPSLRIVADHSRAATFLIADGVIPSNEGRGYVLRKIIRRALLHAGKLNAAFPFLSKMSQAVRKEMMGAYPDLAEVSARIDHVLDEEEKQFGRTVGIGLLQFDKEIEGIRAKNISGKTGFAAAAAGAPTRIHVPGEKLFRLYDTYGLPLDFIRDAVRDQGFVFDQEGFDSAMAEQQQRSKASWKGAHKEAASPVYRKLADTFKTEPDFYFGTTARDCHIEAIVTKNGEVKELKAGQDAEIVLDRTTIYSESGGQVADTGALFDDRLSQQVAEVRGAYYPVAGLIAHRIVAKEDLAVGDRVATVADAARRARVMRNHSGTHLVHAALRNILGTHVKQAGSLNAPDHLRFDFNHFAQLAPEELQEIENQVNEEILRDLPLQTDIMTIDDALASGALAFFGDKYPEQNVRVVTIGDAAYPRGFYSKELCGGTHVARTGEIGVFKISVEQSVAAGVRRIEALTGDAALEQYRNAQSTLRALAGMLNTGEDRILEAVEKLEQDRKQLEKQLDGLKRKTAVSMADSLLAEARTVKGIKIVAAKVENVDREALRQLADGLRQKMGSGVVVLATGSDPAAPGGGKVSLITAVTKDLTNRLHAGKMVQELAKHVGGSGGGRPDLAEAGGKDVAGIETAIAQVYPLIERLV